MLQGISALPLIQVDQKDKEKGKTALASQFYVSKTHSWDLK